MIQSPQFLVNVEKNIIEEPNQEGGGGLVVNLQDVATDDVAVFFVVKIVSSDLHFDFCISSSDTPFYCNWFN